MEPALKPLEEWICDSCGEIISSTEDGYLEWLKPSDNYLGTEHGFRIVHHAPASPRQPHGDCYYDSRGELQRGSLWLTAALDWCVGPDGLVYLLHWLNEDRHVAVDELVEVIRRLHVPLYEEARQYFPDAEQAGFFEGESEYSRYLQDTLKRIIEVFRESNE